MVVGEETTAEVRLGVVGEMPRRFIWRGSTLPLEKVSRRPC